MQQGATMKTTISLLTKAAILTAVAAVLSVPGRGAARAAEGNDKPPAVKSDDWRKPIKDVKVTNAPPAGELPPDAAKDLLVEKKPAAGRDWAETQFNWAPTELAHQPLYFDELALERYGQTVAPRLQPVISGAHFFGTFAILPYKMGLDRAHDCVYTLGHYRPGSCAPCVRQGLPFETDAALFEAGTWVALALLLP